MAALKRSIVRDADSTTDSGSAAKRQRTAFDEPPVNTHGFASQRPWISAELGAGSWMTGHRFTVEYITTNFVPCLKFTSIVGSAEEGYPCRVHEAASPGHFVNVFYMPVRGVLDLLYLALTGNRELVKDRGYDSVLPKTHTPGDDASFYNLVSIGGMLNDMIVPGSSRVPHHVSGMWNVYKQARGPVFITCDTWVDWASGYPQQEQEEQQASEPQSAQDSGVESCPETDADSTFEGAEDQSDMECNDDTDEYDECDDASDDEDWDEDLVFPLCHSCQLPGLLSVIHLWLETRACETRGLLVDCKVPERVTLVPMPAREDNYTYTGLNHCMHWPLLTEHEIDTMNTIAYNFL